MDTSQVAAQENHNNDKGIHNPWLTPPDAVLDSFEPTKPRAPVEPASPPESPAFESFPRSGPPAQDQALFPADTDVQSVNADRPLFEPNATTAACERTEIQGRGISHLSTPDNSPRGSATLLEGGLPVRARNAYQGQPALSPWQLHHKYGSAYYDFVMAENEKRRILQRQSSRGLPLPVPTSTRDPHTEQMLGRLMSAPAVQTSSGRIEKSRSSHVPSRVRSPVQKPIASRPVRNQEPTRTEAPVLQAKKPTTVTTTTVRRGKQKTTSPGSSGGSIPSAPQPKPRTRAAPSKTNPNPGDWRNIPDYSPPLSVLDHFPHVTVAWKNAKPKPIDGDLMVEQLHPLEKKWAESLRMRADLYCECKRRIFNQRVEELKTSGEFNKTKAQSCCTIDVNKTSQLWTVFNEVGWFDEKFFRDKLARSDSTPA